LFLALNSSFDATDEPVVGVVLVLEVLKLFVFLIDVETIPSSLLVRKYFSASSLRFPAFATARPKQRETLSCFCLPDRLLTLLSIPTIYLFYLIFVPQLRYSFPVVQQFRNYADKIVKVPEMAESISEGTLKQWSKQIGDYVEQDEEIATIETDKVSRFHLNA